MYYTTACLLPRICFALCGILECLLNIFKYAGSKDMTFASNNAGVVDFGIGILLLAKQVKKTISSYSLRTPNSCACGCARISWVCSQSLYAWCLNGWFFCCDATPMIMLVQHFLCCERAQRENRIHILGSLRSSDKFSQENSRFLKR
jgi:hypothetical protein